MADTLTTLTILEYHFLGKAPWINQPGLFDHLRIWDWRYTLLNHGVKCLKWKVDQLVHLTAVLVMCVQLIWFETQSVQVAQMIIECKELGLLENEVPHSINRFIFTLMTITRGRSPRDPWRGLRNPQLSYNYSGEAKLSPHAKLFSMSWLSQSDLYNYSQY